MKLSAKSDYAARAVLGLARHYPSEDVLRVEQLAVEHRIPAKYLVQILLELKAEGIVRSQRGKEGGYLLARPPAEINLHDVIRAVDGKLIETPGVDSAGCPPVLRRAWQSFQTAIETAANGITFQQLLEEDTATEKMYYI